MAERGPAAAGHIIPPPPPPPLPPPPPPPPPPWSPPPRSGVSLGVGGALPAGPGLAQAVSARMTAMDTARMDVGIPMTTANHEPFISLPQLSVILCAMGELPFRRPRGYRARYEGPGPSSRL